MWKYLVRRLLMMVPVMLLVSMIAFSIILLLPGDPAMAILGPERARDTQAYQALRQDLGLDKPIPLQYLSWLGKIVTGDLGTSARNQQPVTALLAQSIGPTIQLALTAMLIALVIAVPVGIISAVKPGSWADTIGTTFALSGVAIPNFFLGILLIYVFAVWLGWLAPSGRFGWSSIILPAVTLGAALSALLTRMVRSSVIEEMGEDYVRTARAKGLGERTVVYKHVLKNGLIPVVTVLGLQLGVLLAGAIITEKIFNWPGIGLLLVEEGINKRDYRLVQGCVLVISVTYILANTLTDLLYRRLDPRIRVS